MTTLEKAARALACWPNDRPWVPAWQEHYELAVRRVLTAIREPDEGMIEAAYAGFDWGPGGHGDLNIPDVHAGGVWQAMIDQILSEKPE